jgi:hypothetical protein
MSVDEPGRIVFRFVVDPVIDALQGRRATISLQLNWFDVDT